MQVNNINFCGYKNTFSVDLSNSNTKSVYLSAELTDEGQKDLSKYKELLALRNLPSSNVINCFYTNVNDIDMFFLNEEALPNGKILRDMQKRISHKDYHEEEKFALKAYTLIANITKRMSQNELVNRDNGFFGVLHSIYKNMKIIFNDEKTIKDLILLGTSKNLPIGKCASILNASIQKNMDILFK